MRYIDEDGDLWEDVGDGLVRAVRVAGELTPDTEPATFSHAERWWGPLRAIEDDEPQNAPSGALPRVTDVIDRAGVFQAAHALVQGLEWGEAASVYDVLNVAKWLEGAE